MRDGRVVVGAVLVFAMIGLGTTLNLVDKLWEWLTREGYSGYIILGGIAIAALIGEIILYAKQGWKAAVVAPLAIAPVLAVYAGILWVVERVVRETHALVGAAVLIVLVFGFGLLVERFAKRGKP